MWWMPTSSADADQSTQAVDSSFEASGVSAGYSSVPVVMDVSVGVKRGELVSILGPNGAGKSTLLKAMIGLVPVRAGSVRAFGKDVTGWPTEAICRAGIGYVPQTRDVFGPLTVEENLEMGGIGLKRRDVRREINHVMELFPLLVRHRHSKASTLSGGQRKVLAIGRALVARPRVLVLDEPTANLAPRTAHEVLEEHVRQLAADGTAILCVEQRVKEALSVSDRVYVLVEGRVQKALPAAEVTMDMVGEMFLQSAASVRDAPCAG